MPKLITFSTGNTIEFLYDAAGNKLRKTTKVSGTIQYVQDYFPGGIEYRQTGTGAKRVESVYHAEGRYYNTNVDASNTIAWRKEYSFRDHLGNTRLAFTDRNANGIVDITGTASTSDILQENHYYSFGLAFEGAWLQNDAGVRDNQYMYNGKELHSDFGLGMYAYGARYYDPSIGRFIGVDPISDEFPFVTTFNYAENEPIANIDLHGLQKVGINRLAQIVGLPSSDRGIVKPASERMRENSPAKAAVKDASFIVLELMGINAIDNAIATWLDPNATIKEKVGAGVELGATALSTTKGGSGKGMNNPNTKSAARLGRTKHSEWDPGEGFQKEVKLDENSRADGVKVDPNSDGSVTVHIKELKPNNPRAVKKGEKQLERYTEAAKKKYENVREVITKIETYDK